MLELHKRISNFGGDHPSYSRGILRALRLGYVTEINWAGIPRVGARQGKNEKGVYANVLTTGLSVVIFWTFQVQYFFKVLDHWVNCNNIFYNIKAVFC